MSKQEALDKVCKELMRALGSGDTYQAFNECIYALATYRLDPVTLTLRLPCGEVEIKLKPK